MQQKGFTLIELILSIVLMAIISIVIGKILFQGYQTFLISQNISDLDWQGLLTLEKIVNDIHTLRSTNDIITIQSTELSFTDINGNSVQYQLSGNSILRNGLTLTTGVQSLSLSYKDKNGLTTATPSNTRYITIGVSLTQENINTTFSTMAATR